MNNVFLAFMTGLTSGGISCFSVQSGLLASSVNANNGKDHKGNAKIVSIFIFGKLLSYSALGLLLGIVGSSLSLSPQLLGFFQILAGLFMLVTAGRLLNLHPIFQKFVITPPKRIMRILRVQSKNEGLVTTFFMGLLTVLIPCGVTQAMMVLAISVGNPIYSSLIMGSFVVGTSPIFFLLGMAITEIFKRKAFVYISACIIALLGILSINTGQVVRGSVHTLQNYWRVLTAPPTSELKGANVKGGIQEAIITINSTKYTPSVDTLKVGVPVRLKLVSNNAQGCIRAFTIPTYNISKILPANGTETIEFTPTKTGILTFTCSMGMYSGYFNVVE